MSPFLACGFLKFHQDGGFTLRIRISCFGSWKANWALERAGRHLSLLQASLRALPGSIFKIMMPTEIIWGIFSAVVGVGVGQWARTQALELYQHGPEFQFSDSLVANSWLGFTSLILCFPAKWRWLDTVLCCLSFLSPYHVPGIQGGLHALPLSIITANRMLVVLLLFPLTDDETETWGNEVTYFRSPSY